MFEFDCRLIHTHFLGFHSNTATPRFQGCVLFSAGRHCSYHTPRRTYGGRILSLDVSCHALQYFTLMIQLQFSLLLCSNLCLTFYRRNSVLILGTPCSPIGLLTHWDSVLTQHRNSVLPHTGRYGCNATCVQRLAQCSVLSASQRSLCLRSSNQASRPKLSGRALPSGLVGGRHV